MICMLMFIVKEFFFVDVGVFFDNLILVDIYILVCELVNCLLFRDKI